MMTKLAANTIVANFHILNKNLPSVPFNKNWANGTGYMDGAIFDRTIDGPCRSVDPYGRPMIMIPDEDNWPTNIVFFQRWLHDSDNIVAQIPYSGGKSSAIQSFLITDANANRWDLENEVLSDCSESHRKILEQAAQRVYGCLIRMNELALEAQNLAA